ncbi:MULTISPECIES: hypothetical protein [Lactobacillaceae]|uniref:Uncharacterized protein n=1 Tax=Limosilactobacillus reuteri TaxID=1598 RepID=A0A256VFL4_LIMRT|nr:MULTISPECIES: hypothetical protein [Lactobacillaceae]OYS59512.1 hypothetical protein CBF88_05815 [Limosilactobacillus reuteri]OYS61685.1 hypothetical protein CBF91_04680 [Limosilactobacillus reuteri]OYS72365.1 hypothetical protein CBG01_05700 [Limosilactobacillus reuteri]OYS75303.1 hypothetical protein CBG07_07985 [Limosilactobacillus reuteri]OYS75788.1 hypothetical protein CBG08_03335 [Limosilactobacillus reuteri]
MNKTFAFISSYLPLYILLMINNFNKDKNIAYWIAFGMLIILVMISVIVLFYYLRGKGKKILLASDEQIDKLKSDSMINYLMAYVVPLATISNDDFVGSAITNSILFILIGIIYVKMNLVYLNPVLVLFGYVPYTSTKTGNIYIVNFDIDKLIRKSREGSENQIPTINATIIGNSIMLIRKKDNDWITKKSA